MKSRISVISVIIDDLDVSSKINDLLHQFSEYIIARMGIPYRDRGVSIICLVLDAPEDVTSSISGKLGMLKGVRTKTIVEKQRMEKEEQK